MKLLPERGKVLVKWRGQGTEGVGKEREAGVLKGREAGEKNKTLTFFIY